MHWPQAQWKALSNLSNNRIASATPTTEGHGRLRLHLNNAKRGSPSMTVGRKIWLGVAGLLAAVMLANTPAGAQQPSQKPNILFIMGDDIGIMQPSIYHRGLMVGETSNIDRIGNEGALFTD